MGKIIYKIASGLSSNGLLFNKLELDYVVGNTLNLMKNNELKETYRKKGYINAEGLQWDKVYGMWEYIQTIPKKIQIYNKQITNEHFVHSYEK